MTVDIEACLPPALRGAGAVFIPITAGLSGAGVWRVETGGHAPVALKIWSPDDPVARWHRALRVVQHAADAGLAPGIIHVDDERRAIVSAFVAGSFPALYGNPATRAGVLAQLARTVRRIHALPLDTDDEPAAEPRALLADAWFPLEAGTRLPAYIATTIQHALTLDAPPRERPRVLGHNDANPGNIMVDGEHLVFVDWDHACPNDPFYDLATISVFLGLDDNASRRLLSAYDDADVVFLPARFKYVRHVIGAVAAVTFLKLAAAKGDGLATLPASLDEAPTLPEFYQRLGTGKLSLGSAEGLCMFGLALLKQSAQSRLQ